jgi:RNA polymerase sigma-70 factor (ECF subfamily)
LTSQVFEQMLEHLRQLKPPFHIKQWLFMIARNRIKNYYRSQKSEKNQTISLDMISEEKHIPYAHASPSDERVRNIIRRLTNTEQTIFRLRYLAEMNLKEIMRLTKKSRWAVKKILVRANKKFKKMYREKYMR